MENKNIASGLSIDQQRLVLETKRAERALIVYINESALADENFPVGYQNCLRDEIANHNSAIQEYNEQLAELSKPQP